MLFSSPTFLFLFFPVLLPLYFATPFGARNALLLFASLLFYAWGEPRFLPVMLLSVVLNYGLGLAVERAQHRKRVLALAVFLNLGLLAFYKYTAFFIENLNRFLALTSVPTLPTPNIELPLGISFFTFHALSYVIDVYRRQTSAQKNFSLITLYIAFFPQLIAGPIIRYHEVSEQLVKRFASLDDVAHGLRRFVIGLGKKVLIANTVAVAADAIFALPGPISARVAWLGMVCYTLQIYFDFSGYSDMALGLARVFGFRFAENFNYPYAASSLTDFWRRWHMSLSRWFRDYLYIPLGGNRAGSGRTYLNLLIVFFLCGLWHGASWNFVIWGLLHGAFLALERTRAGRWVQAFPPVVGHAYTLLIVVVAWVFFRAPTLPKAFSILEAMVGASGAAATAGVLSPYLTLECVAAMAVGLVASCPLLPKIRIWRERLVALGQQAAFAVGSLAALSVIFIACVMRMAAGTYDPFIYFRF